MFRQTAPAAIAALLTGCTLAEPQPPIPVIACIGTQGRWLRGAIANPGLSGQFSGRTSDGDTCTARWRTPVTTGTYGVGTLACADGLSAEINYLPLSLRQGIAIGSGIANTGERISVWSNLSAPDSVVPGSGSDAAPRCETLASHRPSGASPGNLLSTFANN